MQCRAPDPAGRALLASLLLLSLSACGGGGGGGAAPHPSFTSITPDAFFAHDVGPFVVLGSDMLGTHDAVGIRFRAVSGAPFQGGTSEVLVAQVDMQTDIRLQGTVPAGGVRATTAAFLELVYPDGTVVTSAQPLARFEPQAITALSHADVGSLNPERIEVIGHGFNPVGHEARVKLRVLEGQLPSGQAVLDADARLHSVERASFMSPRLELLGPVTFGVELHLPGGAVLSTPDEQRLRIAADPFVNRTDETVLYAHERQTLTVFGTGFGPVPPADEEQEPGLPVTIQLLQGPEGGPPSTSPTLAVPGRVLADDRAIADIPDMDLASASRVFVALVYPDGRRIRSQRPLVTLRPQAITSVTPARLDPASDTTTLTIEGLGFAPGSGKAALRLTATEGTPFDRGTSAEVQVVAQITADGAATAVIPNVNAWSAGEARFELTLASGVVLASGETSVQFGRRYPELDPASFSLGGFLSVDAAVDDFNGDGVPDITFLNLLDEHYIYLNGGNGTFPLDLREEIANETPGGTVGSRVLSLPTNGFVTGRDWFMLDASPGASHRVHRHEGNGIFSAFPDFWGGRLAPGRAVDHAGLDFDRDGDEDVVIVYAGDGEPGPGPGPGPRPEELSTQRARGVAGVEIYENRGGFHGVADRATESFEADDRPRIDAILAVAAGDVNGDGHPDVAIVSEDAVHIWRNTTRLEFAFETTLTVAGVKQARLADLDGDGDVDLVAVTTKDVQVYENTNPAAFRLTRVATLSIVDVNDLVLADFDQDGDLDLVFARGAQPDDDDERDDGGRSTLIYGNEGSMAFGDTGIRTANGVSFRVRLGDVNADGRLDLIEVNQDGHAIYLQAPSE